MFIIFIFLLQTSPWTLYEEAKNSYNKEDFETARKKFEEFKNTYKNHQLTPFALYYCAKLEENPKNAVSLYMSIIDSYPESKVADNALYRIAQYYYAIHHYDECVKTLENLIKKYPEADCMKQAKTLLENITPFISIYYIQVGAFIKEENAIKLKEELTKNGFNSLIIKNKYYKVRIGGFYTKESAELFKKEHKIKGFIVKQ